MKRVVILSSAIILTLSVISVLPACEQQSTQSISTTTPSTQTAATATPGEHAVVTFPDKNLEAALRDALGKPAGEEITETELATITLLGAGRKNITDLSGLEYCVNLTLLILSGNQISDLTPLEDLTSLANLWLNENQISDITPLAHLNNLYELNLKKNQITDISPLENLTSLFLLYLADNRISDITPLVENSGLDNGDQIYLKANSLNLEEGSEDMENITALENRGVVVSY